MTDEGFSLILSESPYTRQSCLSNYDRTKATAATGVEIEFTILHTPIISENCKLTERLHFMMKKVPLVVLKTRKIVVGVGETMNT